MYSIYCESHNYVYQKHRSEISRKSSLVRNQPEVIRLVDSSPGIIPTADFVSPSLPIKTKLNRVNREKVLNVRRKSRLAEVLALALIDKLKTFGS